MDRSEARLAMFRHAFPRLRYAARPVGYTEHSHQDADQPISFSDFFCLSPRPSDFLSAMTSSAKKKRERKKDFQKPKLKVGKARPKAANQTDTSFRAKGQYTIPPSSQGTPI